ncbi:DNA adenine methylase [Clostridium sporogenes]|uniref:DNA adenine methylase n=1 Tax=Clostridium botulinum TaxID=1491 RepID=UPI00071778BD|nr:DNA adenine methylase [Clostridium botulinum]KRU29360.1 DNA adenine methylase [Clostridium sporogenes]KRU33448.1 DNA adenine methylase [Clostridium sporogenes]KRU33920.1 DNA adenine methylase [Clostridium sporogenes]KRU43432.1 DNA adenine methylase [Clostridium sporogenes]MBZ1330981.1 DNA adenine methylase [Clostridium botulinum]
MLKPPIPRMGGKSKLRKTIIKMIPEHTCYVELFLGAGWVFFGKEPSKVEVINDIDKDLINLFKMIKYHAPEIERQLEYEFSSRDIFKEYKDCNVDNLTEINRAVRFLYLISQSFASKMDAYGYGTTSRPKPHIFYKNVLSDLKERLRNTYVENLDFEKIIEKYDRQHSFFFCDPPYFETMGYKVKFGEKEHLILRDTLKNLKGKFLLTINDHPQIREWYQGFNIKEVGVNYSVSRQQEARKKYKELIITNY